MSMLTEQQLISFMKEKAYKPMNIDELSQALPVDSSDEIAELILLLNRMEADGLLVRTRTDCYGLPDKMSLVVGTVQGKSKGFAFVIPDSRTEQDVYISAGDLAGALHGDRVIARVHRESAGPRLEGAIIRILQRAATTIVGTLSATEHYAMVRPDDPRLSIELFIPREQLGGAQNGQKVVAEITRYPEEFRAPEGRIIEVLGNPDAPGVDILSIIRKYGLPEKFPDQVLEEADRVSETIREEEMQGRRDLRGLRMVTIDSEHAKDLDDAVSVERLQSGNIVLGVHIADVSYYVREGSALDQEALNRGTSVYLVDRVIPMLPHRLSNGICSLNPQVDRLALTCEMEWHPSGERVRHEIYPSVIRTTERMTYENVKKILIDQTPELMQRYKELVDDFVLMEDLAMKLRARRMKRGAVDFDFPETKVLVDAEGKPTGIVKRERSIAEQIIEEFMLAANETVAEEFHRLGMPFLYRVHEQPDEERIRSLGEFVHNFGYSTRSLVRTAGQAEDADSRSVSPKALQQLLEQVKGKPEERIISTVTLRSM
ncbi:MAG: rnr, partial [Bacilli bacterium]|nr:rnr [Bacilli bacterium]